MAAKKHKILIIEDDGMISSMYKIKFEADGYEVATANNGADGVKAAAEQQPAIIMLDIILPQLDGFTVLQELKKGRATKQIPVIMLTNLGTDEDKNKGKKLGAVDYIVKASLTPAQISQKLKQYLK